MPVFVSKFPYPLKVCFGFAGKNKCKMLFAEIHEDNVTIDTGFPGK
jgi:hypothetical protein